MTGRELVSACLRKLGALAPVETLAAQEATDGLAEINRMISSWSNEGLLIHVITQETPFTLTAGDGSITLGASGDLTNRPQEIVAAAIRDGSTDYPVNILTVEEYTRIPDKTVQSNYPSSLYDDGAFPQRTINLYPVPSAANSLVLWTKRVLTAIATLDTSISLPPGYEDALVYNGAIRLAPDYGKSVSAEVAAIASENKDAIKRMNVRVPLLACDPGLVGAGHYNIYTGGYTP